MSNKETSNEQKPQPAPQKPGNGGSSGSGSSGQSTFPGVRYVTDSVDPKKIRGGQKGK